MQIRGVPDDVHRQLKAKAALQGQSLNDFLLERLTAVAEQPTMAEWLAEMRERAAREPYEGPSIGDLARMIREDRDRDDR